MTRRWAPQTCCTLRRNTANIMKGLVLVHLFFVSTVRQVQPLPHVWHNRFLIRI